jgi:phosphotransferase system HPr-like phosphotransfer protein
MLALIAVVVAVAVIALGSGGNGVQLRRVVANDAQQAVQQLQDLVDQNTK